MNDLRRYSREFVIEFIELYKSLPAVWKLKSKEYSNRDKKAQAYDILVDKWKEVEPRADRDFVVKKINSMRTVYRRELKKLENEYSGMDTDVMPSPNLWYFHLLDFLRHQESSGLEQETIINGTKDIETANEQITLPGQTSTAIPKPTSSLASSTISSSRHPKKTSHYVGNSISRLQKRPRGISDSILIKLINKLDEPPPKLNRCDYMARAWAETLKSLPVDQRIYAERIINEVLSEAQLNTLTRESHLEVNSIQLHEVQTQLQVTNTKVEFDDD